MLVHSYVSCGPLLQLSISFFVLNMICCEEFLFLSWLFGVLSFLFFCVYGYFILNLGMYSSMIWLKVWSMLLTSLSVPITHRCILLSSLQIFAYFLYVFFVYSFFKLSFSYIDWSNFSTLASSLDILFSTWSIILVRLCPALSQPVFECFSSIPLYFSLSFLQYYFSF